jgi:hypothetical protein
VQPFDLFFKMLEFQVLVVVGIWGLGWVMGARHYYYTWAKFFFKLVLNPTSNASSLQ